jgi:PrtD family type I secretion system ABC transporter
MKLFGAELPAPLEAAVRACRHHLVVAAAMSALVNILYLAPTIYMMQVYDRVVPTGGIVTLVWITVIVAFAIGTLSALEAVRTRVMIRASLRLDRLLSGDILDRLLSASNRSAASNGQAMREFDTLRQTFGGPAMIALFDAPWTPLYLIVAFIIHPVLGGLVLLGGGVLFAIALANERQSRAQAHAAHGALGRSYGRQEAILARAEIVRGLGMRRALVARQLAERHSGMSLTAEAQFTGARFASLAKFFRLFLQSLALGVAAFLAVERQISVGQIIAGSVLLSRALQPIELLVGSWRQICQAREAVSALAQLFHDADNEPARMPLPAPAGRINVERVVVRAPEQESLILKGISFDVAPGEMIGIVGPSGAGKTTLARVVAGALAPDRGMVRIDGANYQDWDAELLAAHIGYLPQEASLIGGSIAENISRFDQGNPNEIALAVVTAAMAAGAHDLIQRLPNGYGTQLDNAGRGLSAGQAQRVALARALYGSPAVLVMDEPNSAVDAEGEAALTVAIADAKARGAAVIVVAHRIGILNDADTLLVLRDGMIDRMGPSEDILAYLSGRPPAAKAVELKSDQA